MRNLPSCWFPHWCGTPRESRSSRSRPAISGYDDGVEQQLTLDEDTGGEPLALVVAVETAAPAPQARRLQEPERRIAAVVATFLTGLRW